MPRNESARSRPQLVNWELAASTAASLTPAGPTMEPAEIARSVQNIRRLADESVAHVHTISRLDAARDLRDSELLVIDRASWSRANAGSFRTLLEPALARLAATRPEVMRSASLALGGTLTGVQLGTILAFLSSKVLGQYDPFVPSRHGQGGRLMLVAPNIISVERELNVDPSDFRLWVCLHEQTHRVQFAAAPWLRDHLSARIAELTSGLMDTAETLSDRLGTVVRQLGAAPRHRDPSQAGSGVSQDLGVLSILQGPEDKVRLSHLTAVMSLLEGHANVVMDGVDGSIVPSVRTIRRRFEARSSSRGPLERMIRQIMGLDAKMRQYADGSRFVRRVVGQTGVDGFNAVWESAAHLPTEQEIHAPDEWIDRMSLERRG